MAVLLFVLFVASGPALLGITPARGKKAAITNRDVEFD
jgi:hypothetical protein